MWGEEGDEFRGELGCERVAEAEVGGVIEQGSLMGDGGGDFRVAMAVDVCPDGGVAIEVAVFIFVK